jgi:histidinol-phosphate aminotransferase
MTFVSDRINEFTPYTAGEQTNFIVKLNANENPYPPSPAILEAIKGFKYEELRLYPDMVSKSLRGAIGARYGLNVENVFVGNGSDEILALIYMAFFDGECEKLAYPDVSYSFYPVYSDFFKVKSIQIPLKEDFTIDLSEYDSLDVKGFMIANPNAPTSIAIKKDILGAFIKRHPDKLVIVDEAYGDFSDESVIDMIKDCPNLLIVRTYSKGFSLAGMRCGYALGNKALIDGLMKVKDSFNSYPLDLITQKVAEAAVKDIGYYSEINGKIRITRDRLTAELRKLDFILPDSGSNFLFATHKTFSMEKLYLELKKRGILIRYWNKPRINNRVRITVGTDEQADLLIEEIKKITLKG